MSLYFIRASKCVQTVNVNILLGRREYEEGNIEADKREKESKEEAKLEEETEEENKHEDGSEENDKHEEATKRKKMILK